MIALPFDKAGYFFIESLLHPATGLAASREGECYTTIYNNALAAMALLHEGNGAAAEKIFEIFRKYYQSYRNHFHGFPRVWNTSTGVPEMTSIHWEGETAFLLLALNYYRQVVGSYGKYHDLAQGLVSWLTQRANECEQLLADGVANMYAALAPWADAPVIRQNLNRLCTCFFSEGQISSRDYEHVLEHVIRGVLVFGDASGFKYLPKLARSEIWDIDKTTEITAYSAFVTDPFINIEISAQLLLAVKIWQSALPLARQMALAGRAKVLSRPGPECQLDYSHLHLELEKLQMTGKSNPQSAGLPYFVTERGFPQASTLPVIQPTCYLLFYFWGFNPFAPGSKFVLLSGT